jgi:hypothetical protein
MGSILKKISLPIILASFLIGLIFVFLSSESRENVLVHPTPDNIGEIEYSDKAGTCFTFEEKLVECPKDGGKMIPIQE